jgi:hypothetical protein
MSYDFWIEVNTGGVRPAIIEQTNYTWNVSEMFYQLFGEMGIKFLDGVDCRRAQIYIQHALRKMRKNPEIYKSMNPTNGWGSYGGVLKLLQEFVEWCKYNPNATFRVE